MLDSRFPHLQKRTESDILTQNLKEEEIPHNISKIGLFNQFQLPKKRVEVSFLDYLNLF